MITYPPSQPVNAETALSRKEKIATAAKTTKPAVIAVMRRHVSFERELFVTTLQGHVVQIANLPLLIQSAVPVLAAVTLRKHALATPVPVPEIDMCPTDRPAMMIRVSFAPVANAPTGICNAESRWTETAVLSLLVTVTRAASAAPVLDMDPEITA